MKRCEEKYIANEIHSWTEKEKNRKDGASKFDPRVIS